MKLLRKILLFTLAIVMSLGVVTDVARAQEEPPTPIRDPNFWSNNDILYYDPTYDSTCVTGGGTLQGANTKEKIWNFLTGNDLSAEQAAGIMGNMQAESGFSPTARQGSTDLWNSNFENNAWGIVQWDGGRRFSSPKGGVLGELREKNPELVKYTAYEYKGITEPNEKIPEADFNVLLLFELNYMMKESQKRRVTEDRYGEAANEWETLKLMDTIEEATVFWHNNFEVSADSPQRVMETRGGAAKDVFDEFSGQTAGGSPNASSSCLSANDLVSTLRLYAHPEYHAAPYQVRKEEYISAVTRATGDGRYTGDSCYGGGVDCGAFTTILINDSGFDPTFNHNGKISDGAGYTEVQKEWAMENWEEVTFTNGRNNPDELKLGDVAFRPGHTFMWIGEVEGFETKIASASQCQRAPMSGMERADDPEVTWYRKKSPATEIGG